LCVKHTLKVERGRIVSLFFFDIRSFLKSFVLKLENI